MDFSKFNLTPSAKNALENAKKLADRNHHLKIIDLHLLTEILNQNNLNIDAAFEVCNLDKWVLIQAFYQVLENYKEPKRKRKIYAPEILHLLEQADKIAKTKKHEYLGADHIFLAILKHCGEICSFLESLEIDAKILYKKTCEIMNGGLSLQPATSHIAESTKEENKSLKDYCENLNQKIIERGTFEIFGRDAEIDRAFESLLRKNKSNVILIGEAGVGKTAIVEGMTEKIVQRECPDLLLHKQILSLDVTSIISGTIYRGQMEQRIKSILKELKENPNYILFIDEIHMIIDSSGSESNIDFANILKPVLSRGEISCIGATTLEEYKRFFEKDSALNRRFEKIVVLEPSNENVKKLLLNSKKSYEDFHQVSYSEDVLDLIIKLCQEYLPSRKFPDKAFDILDESGAKTKKKNIVRPQEAKDMESQLTNPQFINDKSFEKIQKKYEKILHKWGESLQNKRFIVDSDVIYGIFADKLDTTPEKIKNKENIFISGKIGF